MIFPSDDVQLISTVLIQDILDAFARARGYDNIVSLCTYATSTNPKFQQEGQYGVDMRDLIWDKSLQIKEDVIKGLRPIPTVDEVLNELPTLVWLD